VPFLLFFLCMVKDRKAFAVAVLKAMNSDASTSSEEAHPRFSTRTRVTCTERFQPLVVTGVAVAQGSDHFLGGTSCILAITE